MTLLSTDRARGRQALVSLVLTFLVGVLTALTATVISAPPAHAAVSLTVVGSDSTAGNRTSHRVTLPATVQAGDSLVLFLAWNTIDAMSGPGAGWTEVEARDAGTGMAGRAWTKTATAADGGTAVTVTSAVAVKSVLSVTAYRSTGGTAEVTASEVGGSNTSTSTHTTPAVAVAQDGSWLVSAWSEKSGVDQTWTLPGTVTQRTTGATVGSGKVSMVVADSNGVVPAGNAAGRTATTSEAVNRSVLFSVVVTPGGTEPTNAPPTAAFTVDCAQLACDFDASGSADPDADSLTYSWTFGDGGTANGVSPSHTYASAGSRTATLTVSDGTEQAQTSREVSVTAGTVGDAELSHIATNTSAGNRTNHRVTIPSSVQPGDSLVLLLSWNTNAAPTGPGAGWTPLQSRDGNSIAGRAWTRVATSADAGSIVTVTTATAAKSVMTMSAYRSTGGIAEVTASAIGGSNLSGTTHTTPAVDVPLEDSWLLSAWSEESSVTQTWALPSGTTQRAVDAYTGTGKISMVVGDSNGAVSTGDAAGRTATTSSSAGRSMLFSVVITPAGDETGETNEPPTASFTFTCELLECDFDASGSTDPNDDPLTYAWDFGDGDAGTGAAASHTYDTAGSRTVTLTVDDGTEEAETTRTVVVEAATPVEGLSQVGAASTSGNRTAHTVTVPNAVQVGDTLLLFLTWNLNSTPTGPGAGWTQLQSRSGSGIEGRVWTRVATSTDAGRTLTVTTPANAKSVMSVVAYRSSGGTTRVTASAIGGVNTSGTTHTTPATSVADEGSWLVSAWSEKSSTDLTWTLPGTVTQRTAGAFTGTGKISMVIGDSGAAVPVGSASGRSATTSALATRTVLYSVVVSPEAAPPNQTPTAAFTVSCQFRVCAFNASGSADPDGDPLTYTWTFGDGETGTGVSPSHTYATDGNRVVTLTVSDGTDEAEATRPVSVFAQPNGTQPTPGHTRLVPERPRTNTPRISNGEIWDIEVVPQLNRVFIAGSFSSIANTVSPTTTINQSGLASYNLTTGLIDTSFRPTFNGSVTAVEASPDGTKLFVGGSFNTVGGVTKQKVASLNLTTGAPLSTFGFANVTNNQVQSLAATNNTVYVGGRYTRVNGVLRTGLAAVDATTGVVDQTFDNSLSGGIGVNGQLGVPQLKLTHDSSKLLVIHTGRQIDGRDRLGMGLIDTSTKELLPWRSTLWDENLARVGGVTRICCGDIAPDDSYFVVSSGSGGDAPPISDTAIAYSLDAASLQNSDAQPLWISRHFDSIYSVAITEQAVYVGGHFQFIESPTSDVPWPGLDNVGYGTGQGLAGYGLGDQVVRRDHIAALNPVDGRSVEWNPTGGSNSFEGDKAMEATSRGLFVGGDGMWKGGVNTGRVGFFDFNTETFPPTLPDTTITTPIEGRVVQNGVSFDITGTARVASGTVGRVQVQVQDRDSGQYLQDDGTAFTTFGGTANTLNATLTGTGTTRTWSLPAVIDVNRNLLVSAQAFTTATGGTGDATRATKKIESFSIDDQTPTTSISGPSGVQTSTSFTMTGTAVDDHGVNRLTYWFRDEQQRYLQDDGTVDDIFNTFSGEPDVIGATTATWSYDVVLPHEGVWRGSATAVDTEGQADLRSATRDWTVDSTAVAPTVRITQPVEMTPPFTVPAVTAAPGSRITFAGSAADDEGLKNVEISLRNSQTGENLGNDCTWGVGISAGNCRISPVDIGGSSYSWSWATPFDLKPGTYTFSVRATDDEDLTTSSTNQGRLTINAQYAGDGPPDTTMTFIAPTDGSRIVNLSGSATDETGVASVRVSLQDRDTGRYLQANGTMSAAVAWREATLGTPNGATTSWSLPAITLPSGGDWRFSAVAWDTRGQQDASAATSSWRFYPGDGLPALSDTLGQPQTGASFDSGKIVVTGRAEDAPDQYAGIADVQVGVVNAAGQWMSSSGTFTSTSPSYRTAFLNSPGSVGSNYSYTTPVIPAGTYSVRVRPVDVHAQIGTERISTDIVVTQPANSAPVPSFTYSCNQNVCGFDGRGSTDENPTTLVYSWTFGGTGSTVNGSGPVPTRTFTSPGTFPVTLTVRDEWNVSVTSAPQNVTITEPAGNSAPVPTFTQSCLGLTCSVSSAGTADPNSGDTISYSWNWGDGTAPSTGASPGSHLYAAAGTYTITLTTTDGWGKSATTIRTVNLAEPASNTAPTAAFTATCASFTTCTMNSAGTVDAEGDSIRYAWDFGDGSTSTSASPSRTYVAPGTYTIVLTATDVWGKSGTATRQVTITEPAGNNAPTAVIASGTCTTFTTCQMSAAGSSDPDTAGGDGIRNYVWSWGDGTPDTTGTSASQSHVFPVAGTYTVTLRVLDRWGRASAPVTTSVTTLVEPAGNNPPTATFNPSCTGRVCAMNATSSDADGGIRSTSWTFGDASTSTSSNPSKTYTAAGTYTITLVVTDNWGRSTTVTRQVTVT